MTMSETITAQMTAQTHSNDIIITHRKIITITLVSIL